jgi:hypothetical protein
MSLTTFYRIIKNLTVNCIQAFKLNQKLTDQIAVLQKMENDKLFVENVRQFFNITKENAEFLCEQGVREGIFEKRIGVLCSNCNGMIYSSEFGNILPDVVVCENCKELGVGNYKFATSSLDKITFYTFRKDHDT